MNALAKFFGSQLAKVLAGFLLDLLVSWYRDYKEKKIDEEIDEKIEEGKEARKKLEEAESEKEREDATRDIADSFL